ncbi:hypothetical protein D3C87_1662040 [compost metagenome]
MGRHGGGEVALGDAVSHLRGLRQWLQDRARQQPGACKAQQQPHQRSRGQQGDALLLTALSRVAGLCHALALELSELVHRCGIGVGRRAQLVGDGIGRQGLAALAAFH